MAASVEGVFRIVDRASGPLRRMEAQSRKTEAALRSTGERLDQVGDRQHVRQLEQTERQMRNVGREARVMERDVGRSGTTMRRTTRDTRGLGDALKHLGGVFSGLRALRIPALILGIASVIKPLISIVGALGGGVTALIPKLTDLAGVAGALPATFAGVGLAVGTAKLAFADLSKAYSGNKAAMQRLTPEARSFLRTLKQYKPVVTDLRKEAQKGLFPGLEYSVRRLQRAVPVVRSLIQRMSREMGQQAGSWANFLTTPGNLRDFNTIGTQGIAIFKRISQGAQNLAAALIDITVAARPFTEWLTKRLLAGTRAFRDFIHQGRESGRLTQFFDRTRQAVERFWDIAKNLFLTLQGIGRAARPLGEDLWRSFDRITRGWSRWVNSTRGQNDLRRYFAGLRPTLRELGGLVGDLAKALFRLSGPESQRQTAGMVHQLREWVPVLESIFNNATAAFGPALLDGIKQLGVLLSQLIGPGGGPLTMFLKTITSVLTVVNNILKAFPILQRAAAAAFTLFAINRLVGRIRSFGGEVTKLAGKWLGVKRAADQAAASEERAAGIAVGGGGAVVAGGGAAGGGGGTTGGAILPAAEGRPAMTQDPASGLWVPAGSPVGPAAAGGVRGALTAARSRIGTAWQQLRTPTTSPGYLAPRGAAGPGRISRAAGALTGETAVGEQAAAAAASLRGLAAGAGKLLAPLAVFSAAAGAGSTPGGFGAKMRGAASALTLGFVAPPVSRDQNIATAQGYAQDFLSNTGTYRGTGLQQGDPLRGEGPITQGRNLGTLRGQIANVTRQAGSAHGDNRAALRGELDVLKQNLRTREAIYKETLRQQRAEANQHSRDHASKVLTDLGKAYDILAGKKGPAAAFKETLGNAIDSMRGMKPAGAKVVAENTLAWAQQQAKSNPAMQKQVNALKRSIEKSFSDTGQHVKIVNGSIRTGSTSEWSNIRKALSSNAEQARQEVNDSFTKIQQKAIGTLEMMGYSPAQAGQLIKGAESGNVDLSQTGPVPSSLRGSPTGDPTPLPAPKHHKKGAKGMRVPGIGTQDNVPIYGYGGITKGIVAPGELLVANRHTEKRIDKMLGAYGTTLGKEVAGEHKPHYASYAYGGRAGGNVGPLAGVHAGVAAAAQTVLDHFAGLSVTSTTGGGHAKGSYHYKGEAVDIGGAPDLMNRAAKWIGRTMGAGLTEGIHNPNLSIKNGANVPASFWGPAVWGEHANHIHIAVAGGAPTGGAASGAGVPGGATATMTPLNAPRSRLRGVPGALSNRAGAAYAAGLTAKIQQALNATGAPGGGGGGGVNTAGGKYDKAALARLWVRGGGSRANANLMAAIALAESGGNPSAHNPSGASGLWQILGVPFPGNPMNPLTNARMAVSKFNSQGLGAWETYTNGAYRRFMARGGRIGQSYVPFGGAFGDGADFVATRPQSIIVGDKGKERVTVTPTNRGGGRPVVLKPVFHIKGGDPQEVEKAVERALKKVARELDLVTQESEHEEN